MWLWIYCFHHSCSQYGIAWFMRLLLRLFFRRNPNTLLQTLKSLCILKQLLEHPYHIDSMSVMNFWGPGKLLWLCNSLETACKTLHTSNALVRLNFRHNALDFRHNAASRYYKLAFSLFQTVPNLFAQRANWFQKHNVLRRNYAREFCFPHASLFEVLLSIRLHLVSEEFGVDFRNLKFVSCSQWQALRLKLFVFPFLALSLGKNFH